MPVTIELVKAGATMDDIVEKLIVVSMPFRQDGPFPEILTAFEQMPANASAIAAGIASSPLGQLYPGVHWESLAKKIGVMNALPYDWTQQVAGIAAPTLLIFADADFIRLEHIAEFYKLLGGGQREDALDVVLRHAIEGVDVLLLRLGTDVEHLGARRTA